MEDLDFTRPARDQAYDPSVARSFFETMGKADALADGQAFFDQDQASDRMYLLLEGQVRLVRGARTLDIINPGEIFGEMAAISGLPRTAAAVAKGACRAASVDAGQLAEALRKTPEFALMLMGVLINRLRVSSAIAGRSGGLADAAATRGSTALDRQLAGGLRSSSQRPPQRFPANRTIMKEGEVGIFMYVVLSGSVAVSVKSKVVDRVGPGGILGEMALVDQSPRAATATAESEAELLPISRSDFLALVKSHPEFAVALLKSLAERLRRMTAR